MRRWSTLCGISVLGLLASSALADENTIKLPGDHEDYKFEAEPRVLIEPFNDFAPGVGFRGTIEVVDNGFVKTINNTVGVGFGADWTQGHVSLPVVMQWNFWLSRDWSVMAEPGVVMVLDHGRPHAYPAVFGGGRYHFANRMALSMRAGLPVSSVGVSFFF